MWLLLVYNYNTRTLTHFLRLAFHCLADVQKAVGSLAAGRRTRRPASVKEEGSAVDFLQIYLALLWAGCTSCTDGIRVWWVDGRVTGRIPHCLGGAVVIRSS